MAATEETLAGRADLGGGPDVTGEAHDSWPAIGGLDDPSLDGVGDHVGSDVPSITRKSLRTEDVRLEIPCGEANQRG